MRLPLIASLMLVVFTGCRMEADEDEDGFTEAIDCNDTDAAINPGADEVCDGVDNDCNGLIDLEAVDATSFYGDADGDGHGNPQLVEAACEAPTGFVTVADDCDDSAADIHPGAVEDDCTDPIDYNCDGSVGFANEDGDGFPACEDCDDTVGSINPNAIEICDGVDNNCDGSVDEDGAVGATDWYADSDADSFGDPSVRTASCDQPTGYVANASDCDDAVATINPSAAETCNDLDDDCNGLTDEEPTDVITFYADSDGDGVGGDQFVVEACAQPTGFETSSDDCDDLDPASYPGASEVCDGADNDCDGSLPTDEADEDSDGFMACDLDCDDSDNQVFTGAVELCNDVDDDCNGHVDDSPVDQTLFYADADGDGFGQLYGSIRGCDAPTGYVDNTDDCDDSDAGFSPSASPGCDEQDHDCDGEIDNDADGDGYADAVCGGSDCDDTDDSILPELGGGCAIGTSCADVLDLGQDAGNGLYLVDPDGFGAGVEPFEVTCDMTVRGGGWTRFLTMPSSGAYRGLQGVPNSEEFVDNGTFQFSKTMMKDSDRQVLILETVAPYRKHMYDFTQGSNLAGEDFVGALTGDQHGTVGAWDWSTNEWVVTSRVNCNTNNHSQWNCEPDPGVRFHYPTRDWRGDGGNYANTGWGWFTGYANGWINPGELVGNWNGQYNKTPHDLFFR